MAGNQGQDAASGSQNSNNAGQQNGANNGGIDSGAPDNSNNGGLETAGAGSQSGGGFETAGAGSPSGSGTDASQGGASGTDNQGDGDDPFADLSAGKGQVMTAAERRAALDARLNEGFSEFDGMILGERERVQADTNDAGSSTMSGNGGSGNGDQDGDAGGPLIVASAPQGSTGGGIMPAGNASREGDFSNAQQQESFPIPDDIPPGANDDVVAKQLREAAMHEPDPELREKLWDEYRAYTGLGQ